MQLASKTMISLSAHVLAFIFLLPVGLSRLHSTVDALLRCPSTAAFQARPWYFSSHPNPQLRLLHNADLYALLLFLPVAAFSHLFLFLTLDHLPFALSAAVSLLFFLLLLLHRVAPASSVPDDAVFLLAALAFVADYGLSAVPDAGIAARTGRCASFVTVACAGACLILALKRSTVAADFALAVGLALKGTWALQVGVTLYAVPPRGCVLRKEGWGELHCELEEDMRRGSALVEVAFAVHVTAVVAGCIGLYWATARMKIRASNPPEATITRPIMGAEDQ